ncbi:MAG: hypothetical protein HYW50_04455 [Candidatus Diapherotrites archaeon]|nr:hypothetical protein [Candidatus Diapherotrites archaeon]
MLPKKRMIRQPQRRKLVFTKDGVRVVGPRGKLLYEGPDRRDINRQDRRRGGGIGEREVKKADIGRSIKKEWLDEAKQKLEARKAEQPDHLWGIVQKKKGKSTYTIIYDSRDNKFYYRSTRRKGFSFDTYDVSSEK